MPWNQKTEFDQRYRFVQQTRAPNACVAQLCRQWKISRKTGYKWIKRYRRDGWRGLQNRPPVAQTSADETGRKCRRRVRQLRQQHPFWGPRKLHHCLKLRHRRGVPSSATIGRWLREWGLVGVRRRRRPAGPKVSRPLCPPVVRPNDLWTVDFKGYFLLGDGTRVEPLTVRDGLSRYALKVELMRQQNVEDTVPEFRQLFVAKGLPRRIRVDNGSPFGSKGPLGLTRLSAWWLKLGIEVEFGRPGHPEDNAGHEQFHGVMKAETASPPAQTWRGQQRRTQRWVQQYNEVRPHEALGMKVPAQSYRPSGRKFRPREQPLSYPKGWESRQVKSNGEVSWHGRARFIGEAFARQRVGFKQYKAGVWRVYYVKHLIGQLDDKDRGGMRPATFRPRRRAR
jgi:transposase InsO family protein